MESEKHPFAVTSVIIGSGKNLLDVKATGEGLLGDQDHHPLSEDSTPQLA